nr:uncharacterized mitochondrial protein AtMg00810-like [Tanacetum cinerariifolium]
MTSLADKAILSGADNHPPTLEKDMYDSWKSIMELYMLNRQHSRMILESVKHGPLLWPAVEEDGVTRLKKYSELSASEAIQSDCDMLMQGTSLTKQERECKLYDEIDKFAYQKGETLCDFYLRFSLLLNDINMYNMKLEQFQVSTKILNTLPPEWSKFVTDVKLVRDLHTTSIDQLPAYLGQHEYHANEQQPSIYQSFPFATSYHTPQFVSQGPSSSNLSISYPVNDISSTVNHNPYMASSSAPQVDYATMVPYSSEFSSPKTGLVVLVFQNGGDPIDVINHMMSFLTAVVTSRYPATNNQLRTSSNPRQQATIIMEGQIWFAIISDSNPLLILKASILPKKKLDLTTGIHFLGVKIASTPIETQKPLIKDEEAADVDVHLYRSMIASLMYLTASRPDIMFAVYACSRFQVTLKTSHFQIVKRIFRYLKGQPKLGLWYPKVSSFDLEAYSDSDYASA